VPSEPSAPAVHEERVDGIPLYLVPKVVADFIREKRERVFQITVGRIREHRYRIVVETFDEHAQRVQQEPPKQTIQKSKRKGGGHG
jgi:hypothetical protein